MRSIAPRDMAIWRFAITGNLEVIMNHKKMVKLSNAIGFIAVLFLFYWVIIFITVQVFSLRIFKERITEIFNFSIIGIFVLLFGALIINIMFNLTRIAENTKIDSSDELAASKKHGMAIFIILIPIIIGILFLGNYISSSLVENNLKKSADKIINTYNSEITKISNYSLTREWLNNVVNMAEFMTKIDPDISDVAIIIKDDINGNNFFLTFNQYDRLGKDEKDINKTRYIRNYNLREREYLDKVFIKGNDQKYFIQNDSSYDLFIPFKNSGRDIVLFFSNRQRYGSSGIGS